MLITRHSQLAVMKNKTLKIILGSVLIAMSCGMMAFGRTPELSGTKWQLANIGGKPVSTKAYVEFNEQLTRVTGNAGCNRMFGSVDTRGRQISFGAIATTKMACGENANRIESQILNAISRVTRLRQYGSRLELSNGNHVILKFSAAKEEVGLEDKKWIVEILNGKSVEMEGTKPFISFDATKQSAGGNTGCNVFGGSYAVSGDTIRIFDTVSTMRACIEDNRMKIERNSMDALQNANRFEIKNRKLYLYRKDKILAVLNGESK